MFSSFPILARAYRTQWRKPQFFLWLFVLSASCALVFGWTYADSVAIAGATEAKLDNASHNLWLVLAWLQTALALLVAPALSAGTIARERERGLLDGLMLAPLTPARIIFEKWLSVLAPLLLVFLVLMPFSVVASALHRQASAPLWALWGFQLLLASASAALGIACSAWARRAHLALRSAYGLLILWVLASGAAAFLSGVGTAGPIFPGYVAPFYLEWIGRTNPLVGAHDLIANDASGNYWPGASATLLLILALCAYCAPRGVRKPLAQIPFIGDGQKISRKRGPTANVLPHFAVPLVSAWRFANPVLGREVRSKFRLRQPPLGVLVFEGILALLVAYFYARTVWAGFTDPSARGIIFGGVVVTSYIVTLIGCVIMGANSFSREHEGGTWESLRLSLLRPREIVRGKAVGIALTCGLFSLAVWPLLLPCVNWSVLWQNPRGSVDISISVLVAVIVIWLGSVITATMWGLWWGRRTRTTSAASGAALGTGTLWFVGVPLISLLLGAGSDIEILLMWINPFGALAQSGSYLYGGASALALPFLAFSLAFSLGVAASLERNMKREFG